MWRRGGGGVLVEVSVVLMEVGWRGGGETVG